MIWILYDIFLFFAGLFMLPALYLKMKRRGGYGRNFQNRFGRFADGQIGQGPRPILIHAVSVGEVGIAMQFINAMRKVDGSVRFVVSTTSSTGWNEAAKRLDPRDSLIYNPLDFTAFVRRTLDAVNPVAYLIVETELWPNMIRECADRGIPVCVVNGRLSDKSAPTYRRFKFVFGPVLRKMSALLVQSELDESRFVDAGADPSAITVTGSFKFDVAHRNEAKEAELGAYLEKCGLAGGAKILMGASTWAGEEKLLAETYLGLRQRHPEMRLVLVPRHFERAPEVVTQLKSLGLGVVRRSETTAAPKKLGADDVLLMDTTGEIMGMFPYATIAVVGRTFYSKGGQNMIEPCLCGIPTIVGPETQNFRPVMSDLLASKAIVQVADGEALVAKVDELMSNTQEREKLGERARKAVESRRGVVDRCVIAVRDAIG